MYNFRFFLSFKLSTPGSTKDFDANDTFFFSFRKAEVARGFFPGCFFLLFVDSVIEINVRAKLAKQIAFCFDGQ